jgi:hypothetical protein
MRDELSSLVESELLTNTYLDETLSPQPLGGYHLDKINGVIFVRKHLEPLVLKVYNQPQIENVINKTQGKTSVKSYFKELLNKLKEKSQDEIVSGLITGAKRYGPYAITIL